jgi:hypothetical protein
VNGDRLLITVRHDRASSRLCGPFTHD